MSAGNTALVLMLGYLAVALVVGLLAGRGRSKLSLSEYAVAERGLGLVVMWFLMGGTIFSAFAFLGGPGWAFSRGAAAFYIVGYVALGMIPWYIIGPRLARLGKERGYLTMGDFVRDHYRSKTLVIVMGLVAVAAFIQYLTLQLTGVAYVFNVMTQGTVPLWAGALIAYGIVIVYVVTGGVRAAAWSDVIQGALMLIVAWVIGLWVVDYLHGSPGEMFRAIDAERPGFLAIGETGSTMGAVEFTTILLVSGIGFLMWPHLFTKSFSTTERRIKQVVISYPLFALFLIPVLFIGFAAVTQVSEADVGNPDQILPYLVSNVLPMGAFAFGLIGAGALAAAMSSADAITHGASVTFTRDVVRPLRPAISERAQVWTMRGAVIGVGAVAYYLAIVGVESLVGLLAGAYGAIVQFAPAVYGALFWRRASAAGAIAGLAVGIAINFYYQLWAEANPLDIHEGILGLIANLVVFVVVSLLVPARQRSPEESAV
ncbi:sodium:solute symporter family protein [Qaidamihabitans albus]|uniref:sodium:solute symporter family protein n=1 Tax=Qaidamihabitans albus TaxID=2795733 RepID=UPI0018F166FA|nr:sodium:solute symporter family protein [Qaidamihabitans albus]